MIKETLRVDQTIRFTLAGVRLPIQLSWNGRLGFLRRRHELDLSVWLYNRACRNSSGMPLWKEVQVGCGVWVSAKPQEEKT